MRSISNNSENNSIKSLNSDLVENNVMFSSLDYVNLKIASKPVKFYKLIHCEKNKINEYDYICEKIKSISQIKNENVVIFLKNSANDEIKIVDESEWKYFFENSGKTIMDLIDSKNTIKIEFTTTLPSSMSSENLTLVKPIEDSQKSKVDDMLKNYFEDDQIGLQILKSIFSLSYKNDKIKSLIKTDLKSIIPKNENADLVLNSKNFDSNLKNFFKRTLDNLQNISQFKEILIKESKNEDSESDIIFGQTDEDEKNFEVASFDDFYNEKEIENLRSKIISESFADIKK